MNALLARLQAAEQKANKSVQAAGQAAAQAQQAEQIALMNQQVTQQLTNLPQTLKEALKPTQGKSLVDPRGLGKPSTFSNLEEDFVMWARKTKNYVVNAQELMTTAAELLEEIDVELLDTDIETETVKEVDRQLSSCLLALTDGYAFDIVHASGEGCGLEAWRRLHKRYEPSTAGRSRTLLRDILSPGRSKLDDLLASIERLEELMRKYCGHRGSDRKRKTLPEHN